MTRPRLAKLSPPKLYSPTARERLFRLLDAKRNHPVVWVTGPPGAGKSTLVASYLVAAQLPTVWYLIDAGDSDPASFFDYLTQAIASAGRRAGPRLPFLTTEYLHDLEGFSRRFLRGAFARLRQGTVVVLDNYHALEADSPLHAMLGAAVEEIPAHANLIIISREQPPAPFSRARVGGMMEVLGWDDLRLWPEETAAIASRRGSLDADAAAAIHRRSGGWAAGVRLLVEHGAAREETTGPASGRGLESTFDYFAAEIFDAAPPPVQNLLLRTAFPPRFTVDMAASLVPDPDTPRLLEALYRRHLFLDRLPGPATTYQYHDLFRTFLQARAQRLGTEAVAALRTGSARLLLEAGLPDDAFALFVEAGSWDDAERVFLDRAPVLITRGRWQTLHEWGRLFPPAQRAGNPWLEYWLGRSKALVDAVPALELLTGVYEAFVRRDDVYGQLVCAATVVETMHFALVRWETMGDWLARLRDALARPHPPLALDDELRVHATLFWSAENADPPVQLTDSRDRVLALLPLCGDDNLRVSVANMLHYHATRTMDAEATRVAARAAGAVLDSPDLSADRRALYFLAEGRGHFEFRRFAEALSCYDRADEIIKSHDLAGRDHIAAVWRTQCLCFAGEIAAAKTRLEDTERLQGRDYAVIVMVLETTRSAVAMGGGDFDRAALHAHAAVLNCEMYGPRLILGFLLPYRAYTLIATGRLADARTDLARASHDGAVLIQEQTHGTVALLEAWAAYKDGDRQRAQTDLALALRAGRDEGPRIRMCWHPLALADLLPLAFENGIEPDVARALVRACSIAPPSSAPASWPWPVRVYALGDFRIEIEDKPLEFARKVPKRTIALLKALLAFGGRNVPEERLADALWPDLDGDAALDSLSAALHRLRRLLASNEVIHQSGGQLSLNARLCYVDAYAFERLVEHPGRELDALGLYGGHFLAREGDSPWSASMRERLRTKFVQACERTGAALEHIRAHADAIGWYRRGIEADPFAEPCYRGLMRCHAMLDQPADVARVFARLRDTLETTLGASPAAESRRLFEQLRRG